jgi:hypothetical protein
MNDTCDVGSISTTVALGGNVEGLRRVLRETFEEQLKERMNIFSSDGTSANGSAVFGVRVPNVNWLIEENNICMGVPAEGVMSSVEAVLSNAAGPKFEQQSG